MNLSFVFMFSVEVGSVMLLLNNSLALIFSFRAFDSFLRHMFLELLKDYFTQSIRIWLTNQERHLLMNAWMKLISEAKIEILTENFASKSHFTSTSISRRLGSVISWCFYVFVINVWFIKYWNLRFIPSVLIYCNF